MDLQAITADLHARPEKIAPAVASKIDAARDKYEHIFVAYGDCGTSGELDRVLEERGVKRLPGAHCYDFLAGRDSYQQMQEDEPGTFYLTDFLAKHFDRLVVTDLKLDKYPELEPQLFGHYRKVVYLAQVHDDTLRASAARAAERLGLPLEIIETGYGQLASSLQEQVVRMIP